MTALPHVDTVVSGPRSDGISHPDWVDQVTVAPGWKVRWKRWAWNRRDDDTDVWIEDILSVDHPGIAPHTELVDRPHQQRSPDYLFPGGIVEQNVTGLVGNPVDLAVEIITLVGVAAAHEAMEWVRVNGMLVGDPHPDDTGPSWETLREGFRATIRQHISYFPPPSEAP